MLPEDVDVSKFSHDILKPPIAGKKLHDKLVELQMNVVRVPALTAVEAEETQILQALIHEKIPRDKILYLDRAEYKSSWTLKAVPIRIIAYYPKFYGEPKLSTIRSSS